MGLELYNSLPAAKKMFDDGIPDTYVRLLKLLDAVEILELAPVRTELNQRIESMSPREVRKVNVVRIAPGLSEK